MTNLTKKHAYVILLLAHKWNQIVEERYRTLLSSSNIQYDVVLLLNEEAPIELPEYVTYYKFSIRTILKLNYIPISLKISPDNKHLPLLQFYKDFPDYNYYWNIEYDVYFTGDWNIFFNSFSDVTTDFLSTHIQHFLQDPYMHDRHLIKSIFHTLLSEKVNFRIFLFLYL